MAWRGGVRWVRRRGEVGVEERRGRSGGEGRGEVGVEERGGVR